MGIKNFFVNEKAILEILDLRDLGTVATKTVPTSDGKTKTVSLGNAMDNIANNSMLGGLGNMVGQDFLVDAMENTLKTKGITDVSNVFGGSVKTFEVQFNPSDLQIEGYGGGRIATQNYEKQNGKDVATITFQPAPVNIRLSVKLMFDSMDANECFLSAKTNIAGSELVKSAAKKALTKLNKKLTVQQEVEGLIAALRSPYTRRITFNWGDMCYSGVLNRISSQYTMFNTAGEPVRAVVQLSLICADERISPTSLGAWQEAYNEAFGAGSKSLVNSVQKVGSLLNIGI